MTQNFGLIVERSFPKNTPKDDEEHLNRRNTSGQVHQQIQNLRKQHSSVPVLPTTTTIRNKKRSLNALIKSNKDDKDDDDDDNEDDEPPSKKQKISSSSTTKKVRFSEDTKKEDGNFIHKHMTLRRIIKSMKTNYNNNNILSGSVETFCGYPIVCLSNDNNNYSFLWNLNKSKQKRKQINNNNNNNNNDAEDDNDNDQQMKNMEGI